MVEAARDRARVLPESGEPGKPVAKRWSNHVDGWVPEHEPSEEDEGVPHRGWDWVDPMLPGQAGWPVECAFECPSTSPWSSSSTTTPEI